MAQKADRNNVDKIKLDLDLGGLDGRDISCISGGELQRFAIAMVCVQEADMYLTPTVSFILID